MIFKLLVYTLSELIYTELIYGFQALDLLILSWGCFQRKLKKLTQMLILNFPK